MRARLLQVLGLVSLAAAAMYGQPTDGAKYWSTTVPTCTSVSGPYKITNSSGALLGYSCAVAGTFPWLAAGGGWGTSIRVAAPASGAVGVDYMFYDGDGNSQNMDTQINSNAAQSGSGVSFALYANQPVDVTLLGATSNAPNYGSTTTGSVYAVFYCPNQVACLDVLPQLIYSNLPSHPWSLSVPITWDGSEWYEWSAQGIDDGGSHLVSFVVYNESLAPAGYTIRVYDSTGALAGIGTTPIIPPVPKLSNGSYGEGGTYGALLRDVIPALPPGIFKIHIDGGSSSCAVAVLQFNGASATALQVGYDVAVTTTSAAAVTAQSRARRARVSDAPRTVFAPLAY